MAAVVYLACSAHRQSTKGRGPGLFLLYAHPYNGAEGTSTAMPLSPSLCCCGITMGPRPPNVLSALLWFLVSLFWCPAAVGGRVAVFWWLLRYVRGKGGGSFHYTLLVHRFNLL